MSLTVFGVVGRLLMILVLMNLRTITRWKRIVDDWIHLQYTTALRRLFTGTVADIIETEHYRSLPPPTVESPAINSIIVALETTKHSGTYLPFPSTNNIIMVEIQQEYTRNGPRTLSQQVDTPPADTCAPYLRYYVGPALYCTRPPPPPASVIIASNFVYPPPPLLQYYIGPAIFDVTGPPPMPCCVAESKFEYPPPPPVFAGSRRPLSYPPPPVADDCCPAIRWSDISFPL